MKEKLTDKQGKKYWLVSHDDWQAIWDSLPLEKRILDKSTYAGLRGFATIIGSDGEPYVWAPKEHLEEEGIVQEEK